MLPTSLCSMLILYVLLVSSVVDETDAFGGSPATSLNDVGPSAAPPSAVPHFPQDVDAPPPTTDVYTIVATSSVCGHTEGSQKNCSKAELGDGFVLSACWNADTTSTIITLTKHAADEEDLTSTFEGLVLRHLTYTHNRVVAFSMIEEGFIDEIIVFNPWRLEVSHQTNLKDITSIVLTNKQIITFDGRYSFFIISGDDILTLQWEALKITQHITIEPPVNTSLSAPNSTIVLIPSDDGDVLLFNDWPLNRFYVMSTKTWETIGCIHVTHEVDEQSLPIQNVTSSIYNSSTGLVCSHCSDGSFVFNASTAITQLFIDNDIIIPYGPKSKFGVVLSSTFGFIYLSAWLITYYPQLWMNFSRKRVDGLSLDFLVIDLIGYCAYTAYTIAQYNAQLKQHSAMAVEPHDMVFAVHSLILTILIGLQCLIYPRGGQRIGNATVLGMYAFVLLTLIVLTAALEGLIPMVVIVSKQDSESHKNTWDKLVATFSFVAYFGYVKSFVTLVKYIPQVLLNFNNKSTKGMSIITYIFDFVGGIFSLLQNCVDALNYMDPTFLSGNIPKLIISVTGMISNVVVFIQHYILYRQDGGFKMIPKLSNEGRFSFNTKRRSLMTSNDERSHELTELLPDVMHA